MNNKELLYCRAVDDNSSVIIAVYDMSGEASERRPSHVSIEARLTGESDTTATYAIKVYANERMIDRSVGTCAAYDLPYDLIETRCQGLGSYSGSTLASDKEKRMISWLWSTLAWAEHEIDRGRMTRSRVCVI